MDNFNYSDFFSDGFTQTNKNNINPIQEGFKESDPFLSEEESEKKKKDTSVKILLENIRTQKNIQKNQFKNKTQKGRN